ncbi:MAG TPA: DUF433 domain-containing protein [Anaeromyxobacter sp.]|nr:DUF433 domain-containing protein [Anaeromyxobacter sp.]
MGTAQRLERHAEELGLTQTALVERYIEEGLRMDAHPLIRFRDGFGGRRPTLLGTRIDVWQVIETLRENDRAIDDTAAYLGVPAEHVRACVRYYADFQAEIDDWTQRARTFEEREDANWRRQQELLA